MPINKIEVVGHNPGQATPGIAVGVPIGEKLTINPGDIVRVHVSFDHRGPAEDLTLLCCIGHITATIFIEDACASIPIHLSESMDYIPYEASVDIDTSPISGGVGYDLEAEITQYTRATHIEVPDVIDVTGEYELLKDIIAPLAYFYKGDVEVASISFTLIKGTTWLATDMANRFANELGERDCTLIEGKFYKDASAIIQDRYLVEITYVVPSGAGTIGAIGFYIPPVVWNVIFYAALGALVAFLVSRAVNWVKSMFYSPPPLSEKVKAEWDSEVLIPAITQLRPAYTAEELAGKTDQELRDVLDEIYEEEVPPTGIPWWGWAILGGVGIAGGALALRFLAPIMPKKKG